MSYELKSTSIAVSFDVSGHCVADELATAIQEAATHALADDKLDEGSPVKRLLERFQYLSVQNKTRGRSFQQACRCIRDVIQLHLDKGKRHEVDGWQPGDDITCKIHKSMEDGKHCYSFVIEIVKPQWRGGGSSSETFLKVIADGPKHDPYKMLNLVKHQDFDKVAPNIDTVYVATVYDTARSEVSRTDFLCSMRHRMRHAGFRPLGNRHICAASEHEMKAMRNLLDLIDNEHDDNCCEMTRISIGKDAFSACLQQVTDFIREYRDNALDAYKGGVSNAAQDLDSIAMDRRDALKFMQETRKKLAESTALIDEATSQVTEVAMFAEDSLAENGLFNELFDEVC